MSEKIIPTDKQILERQTNYNIINDCMKLLSEYTGINYGAIIDFDKGEVSVTRNTPEDIRYEYSIQFDNSKSVLIDTLKAMLVILQ